MMESHRGVPIYDREAGIESDLLMLLLLIADHCAPRAWRLHTGVALLSKLLTNSHHTKDITDGSFDN